MTRGSHGCIVKEEVGDPSLVPAFAVVAVDTTAAGDCFNGALATALAEGQSLRRAAHFASAAAALSVTSRGAIPSLPSRQAVDALLDSDADRLSVFA